MDQEVKQKIKCIIVDDEPLAIEVLRWLLTKFEFIDILAECKDTFQAFDALQEHDVDLMFLDIHMPEVSGLDFLKNLRSPPAVILTTAHREFALEAFELSVIDYLMKPISSSRLMKALDKFSRFRQAGKTGYQEEEVEKGNNTAGEFLVIRADRKSRKVFFQDIDYIESIKDYVRIHTLSERIMTKMTLNEMESRVPAGSFLRVHRSYIVNVNKVTALTSHDVEIGNIEIPVGDTYRKRIERIMKS